MIPILYSEDETAFDNNGIGSLCDITLCRVTEERNGSYEIEFKYPIDGALYSMIKEGCFVKAKTNEKNADQIFHIYKSSKPFDGIVTFYGEHISYELTGNPIEKVTITNATGAQAINKVLDAALVPHSYRGLSDIASRKSTELALISTRAALGGASGSLLDIYGGEFEFDNFTIHLHESRGSDTGIIIGYGKNLTDLTQEKNISETYTALFPYAKYTPEKGEDDEDDPEEVIITLSEKIIYSTKKTRPKVLTMDFSDKFSDGEEITEAALRAKAQEWAASSGYNKPSVSINVSFVHLWQSPEYTQYAILERVSLCDTLTVNFEKLGVSARAKVIKTVYDTLNERYVSIELGDAKSNLADTVNNTSQKIEDIKQEVAKNETAAAKKIIEAVKTATALITGQNGGYVVLNPSANPQEILIMDKPSINEAVKIWRWNPGGLGYSQNGYNGPFTTAITQDGAIVADFITAGEINGALIKADTVSASAISQSFKTEISEEIGKTAQSITQLFSAADGNLKSEIETAFKNDMNSLQSGLLTQINQNAENITLMAEQITSLSNETYNRIQALQRALNEAEQGIEENSGQILDAYTKINENAEKITLEAANIRGELVEIEGGLTEQITANQAEIETNADNIKLRVAKSVMYETATRSAAYPTAANTTAAQKKKLYFCTTDEKYYYFNELSKGWEEAADGCIYSAFIQTADGFRLSGLVEIDGDLITTGIISADRISTEISQVNKSLNIGAPGDSTGKTITFSNAAKISSFIDGYAIPSGLYISASTVRIGSSLDLSRCYDINWGDNAPGAVFG